MGSYDSQGRLELGNRIDIDDANGRVANIKTIATTNDGHVLIGGDKGVFYVGLYDGQRTLALGKRIDVCDMSGDSAYINSIAVTKDGRVLIGGPRGTLYAGAFDISFETLKQHLPDIIKRGEA